MSAAPRAYGPHREDDVPKTLTALEAKQWPQEVEIPYPDALARQRRNINNRAWVAGLGGDATDA